MLWSEASSASGTFGNQNVIQICFHLGESSENQIRETLPFWLPNMASISTSEVVCNNVQLSDSYTIRFVCHPPSMPSATHAIRLVRMVATFGHQMRNVPALARHRACSVVATFGNHDASIQIRFHLGEPSGKQIRETLPFWLPNMASTSTSEVENFVGSGLVFGFEA